MQIFQPEQSDWIYISLSAVAYVKPVIVEPAVSFDLTMASHRSCFAYRTS